MSTSTFSGARQHEQAITDTLFVESCPTCHVLHAIPLSLRKRALANPGSTGTRIYCCNGHPWWYPGKPEADRLREQLDAVRSDANHQRERRQRLERRLIAAKGQQTRLRRRIAAGVCPCCKRTFQDLARHMAGQHPAYVGIKPAPEAES